MSFQRRLSLNLSAEQKQKFYFSSIYFSQLYIAFHGKSKGHYEKSYTGMNVFRKGMNSFWNGMNMYWNLGKPKLPKKIEIFQGVRI